jgi:hypothetical protein
MQRLTEIRQYVQETDSAAHKVDRYDYKVCKCKPMNQAPLPDITLLLFSTAEIALICGGWAEVIFRIELAC